MANAVHPYGFWWVEDPHGTSCTPRVKHFTASGEEGGSTLYRGQPVKLVGGYLYGSTGDGSVGDLVGICDQYVILAAGESKYDVPVVLASHAFFAVQTDSGFVCADRDAWDALIGADKYDISNPSSGRSNGSSSAVLNSTGGGQALILVDYPDRPDNEFGPYMDVIVRFDETQFRGQPEFVNFD